MLDIKWIKENLKEAINRLETRGGDFSYLAELVEKDDVRRTKIAAVEQLKSTRNQESKRIGQLTKEKKDTESLKEQIRNMGDDIKTLDEEILNLDLDIKNGLLLTPNIPNELIPIGSDESSNQEVHKWGHT